MRLHVTYCSGKKRNAILSPDKLYVSARISKFTDYCKNKNLNWAIISAKHGFFFPEEKEEPYDVTLKTDNECLLGVRIKEEKTNIPKEDSDFRLRELIAKLKEQANERCVNELIFYTWSLKQPKCYLTLLHFVFDSCDRYHSWRGLLECIERNARIQVFTQLNFV